MSGAFLAPAFSALAVAGVQAEKLLCANGFGNFRMHDPSATLPRFIVGHFFEHLVRDQGIEVLNELSHAYTMKRVPDWGELIIGRPDILSAIRFAASPAARVISHNRISVGIHEHNAVFTDHFYQSPAGQLNWESVFSMPLALNAFHLACGQNWIPKRIDLSFDDASLLDGVVDFGNAEVRINQPSTRFHFDPVFLGSRMPTSMPSAGISSHVPVSSMGRVFALLDALNPEARPSIALIAASLDMSPRTLERLLAAEEETFSGVLKTWRIGRAFDLLQDPHQSIAEIARCLHYSNTSHFDRAFRGWTHMTPKQFRDQGGTGAVVSGKH